jgi:hypothetical protein
MARLMPAGLMEALNRPNARFSTHGTLELFILTGAETKSYYFATATLNFNGVAWQPHLRKSPEISSSLLGEADMSEVELQNVDTILGIEFANLERYLSGAEAKVGRYWKDLERGAEWHKVFLTGLVEDVSDDEMTVKVTIRSDIYADVSVGPLRHTRRICQAQPYKGFECGSTSDLPTCDRTLTACQQRHSGNDRFPRHMGAPYLDNNILQKIV